MTLDAQIFPHFILSKNSTCFGHSLCPSSGVFYCTFGIDIFLEILKTSSKQGQDDAGRTNFPTFYFVKKLYMFQAFPLPIIRSFLLYIRH